MVGMVATGWGDKAANLLISMRSSMDIASKTEKLRKLKVILLHRDPSLLPELLPLLVESCASQPSPVRRLLAQFFGEVGTKNLGLLPQVFPTLISFLKDEIPAVTRQSIASGTLLFICTLKQVALQGLYLNDSSFIESTWSHMLKFKDAVFPLAFQCQNDGVRLLAIKFIESLILLYSPDPSGSLDPPQEDLDEAVFNASWLRGGHPVLKVADLSTEACESLGLLLDLLRSPQEKPISNSITIILINSLSAIAKNRPSFYGRILPVLLRLDPENSVVKGVEVPGAFHALKNAFNIFLKCAHPGAAPWRARLVEALKCMDDVVPQYQSEKQQHRPLIDSYDDHMKKRVITDVFCQLPEDDEISSKKARSTVVSDQDSTAGTFHESFSLIMNNDGPSSTSDPCTADGIAGPVQQLVGVFGELVAQGGKAAGSLDVLISNISSDLLAEVVMTNMQNLPLALPSIGVEHLSIIFPGIIAKDQSLIQSSSFVSDMLMLSSTLLQLDGHHAPSHDVTHKHSAEVGGIMSVDASLSFSLLDAASNSTALEQATLPSAMDVNELEKSCLFTMHVIDTVPLEDSIPGLGIITDDTLETIEVSHTTNDIQGRSQDQVSSESLLHESASSGSMSTYVFDQLSTQGCIADGSEAPLTSSIYMSNPIFLPKMNAPVIDITDELKDDIQKLAFARILGNCKHFTIAGLSNISFSLLACLGAQFPWEVDAWAVLLKHISTDYINNEGHELTLHVLYRLYQYEQDQDFFSSTNAAADYEKFLLSVAGNLRDLFPASDKSLSRLLCEVPYVPKPVLKLLECLCSPEVVEKNDKDMQISDRVTQGLSTVWSLILQRPADRDACLEIALKSAVHPLEEVRMKAIRLVANKLFPLTYISQKIEDFACQMLSSVVDNFSTCEGVGKEDIQVGITKDADLIKEGASVPSQEISPEGSSVENSSSTSISEVQRCTSLFFALCTKKHSLLRKIFVAYKAMSQVAKEAVHRHMPILIRTTGATSDILDIISDPSAGSEALLVQVAHTLTDGAIPSQELINLIKKLYDTKLKDIEILIPVLPFLGKDEVLLIFPKLVDLPSDRFQVALSRILQGSPLASPSLTPEEVLIALHGIDPDKDSISLKKILDACSSCFEQRQVFTQQVLAKALNQLVEQIPLPFLFMRTVIQAVNAFPALVDFIMDILSRLVSKQIWKYPKLWVGFLKCAVQTKPHSFNVLLQLPAAQLENALNRNAFLKSPVTEHANQSHIRSTLPRATLVVLGLVSDSQTFVPASSAKSQSVDPTTSTADAGNEVNQDSTTG